MAEPKRYITSDELKTHNKAGDVWISIQGKVYDVSEWMNHHPGGEVPLLNFAGQDATDAFVAYHPGTAWKFLQKYFNGFYLKDYYVSEMSKDYRKLVNEFSKIDLFDQKGHLAFITICIATILFVVTVCGVVFCEGNFLHFLCGCLMGFLWVQNGWLAHDSAHYQMMPTRKLNGLAQLIFGNCLSGVSIEWWKWTHNGHHISCNSLDYDPNLQFLPLFAVSSNYFSSITSYFFEYKMDFDSVARLLVSYQHWTFYPVMCLARIDLFAQSFILLLAKRKVPHRSQGLLSLLVFWIWYPLLVSYLPNWSERMLFVFANLVVIGIQHVQFCLNHFSSSVYIGQPKGNDWFEKQTSGTLNIKCSSWMDWFHGGLQFQIEHHLFPRLPRSQLRRVSPLVKELCKKHGLPYNSASFWEANAMTIRTLKNVAMEARDFTKPVPKNLVWEAVKTHG
ncbi:hypothetical protein BUALT_Bualt10G0124600 [Buddleja alternifolia]|uniref:Cytochrome b5 heme-binding domain-containing protein n=1 Tax=Buddleja alternifolia TaxID=168488 RepID=A0AAV6X8X7_9LAMI|nr:hypothetical protein BUALT_Bualt10G0124600 [Buddleja alternifolia]